MHDAGPGRRKEHYRSSFNRYYDLLTDSYEFGWEQFLHFAPRHQGESREASLLRHHGFLADRLSLTPGMQVLDAGCGAGEAMANLARKTGAGFVGINNSAYQIARAKEHTRDVRPLCRFIHGDHMQIPEVDDHYDAAMAIESMLRAPDRTAAFREIFRVLRPGACFAGYDWCLTGYFDRENPAHLDIKRDIQRGGALPELVFTSEVCEALSAAGFELLESRDLALESYPRTPWYRALQGRYLRLKSIPRTPIGRAATSLALGAAELFRLVPRGMAAASTLLNKAADALIEGGKSGVFTPMFFFLARKPEPGD